MLGLAWRGNLGLTNRRLEATLEARARLAGVLRELRPRILFAPYWDDAHPDHVAASALVDAARFWAKLTRCDLPGEPHYPKQILYYFSVHFRIHPRPSFVLDITPYLEQNAAVACYRSQFIEGRLNDSADAARRCEGSRAFWGWAIGTAYGEPFVRREEVGLRGLRDLV